MAVKLEKIVKTYYDNLEKGKILGRRCLKCGNMEWPPVYACNICGHMETEWAEIDGSGEMTMLVLPSVMSLKPQLKDLEPYCYATVKLKEGIERNVMVTGVSKENEKYIRANMPYPVHAAIVQRDGFKTAIFTVDPVSGEGCAEEAQSRAPEMSETLTRLIPLVARAYKKDAGEITASTRFEDFKVASVVFVGLIASLEDEFDSMISITEASSRAKTVGELADLIDRS